MGKGRFSLIAGVLLLSTAMPALRCLIPTESITAEERACCKHMAGDCGQTPANHECCKKTVSTPQPAVTSARITVLASHAVLGTVHSTSPDCVQPLALAATELLDPSPPPSAFTVLRI
jgi:hypothetical protein